MRLGGWMRLWLVLVVLYGLGVAVVTFSIARKEEDLWRQRASSALRILAEDVTKATGRAVHEWDLARSAHFKDKSNREIAEKISADARRLDPADPTHRSRLRFREQIAELDKEHDANLKALPRERLRAAGIALVFWLVPAFALLGLGHAVGWIYRGFRDSGTLTPSGSTPRVARVQQAPAGSGPTEGEAPSMAPSKLPAKLVSRSCRLFAKHLGVFATVGAVGFLVGLVPLALGQFAVESGEIWSGMILVFLGLGVWGLADWMSLRAALVALIQGSLTFSDALQALQPGVLLRSFALMFLALGAMGVGGVLLIGPGILWAWLFGRGAVGISLLVLGSLVAIVLAIAYGTRLVLAGPIVLVEVAGPVSAMRRSWRLVRGHTGRVLVALLPFSVATVVLQQGSRALNAVPDDDAITLIVTGLVMSLVYFIVFQLQSIAWAIVYRDLSPVSEPAIAAAPELPRRLDAPGSFRCWHCKTTISVTPERRGHDVQCPSCGTKQAMPI